MSAQRFKTTITRSGARTFIVLPFNPNEVWGAKSRHYVTGAVNGCRVRGSLGTRGGEFFLPLGEAWRRGCGLEAGASVEVALSPEGPQSEGLSADVAAALGADPAARAFFDGLATFYRNTYIRWIESAKRPETRRARIDEMVRLLAAGRKQK